MLEEFSAEIPRKPTQNFRRKISSKSAEHLMDFFPKRWQSWLIKSIGCACAYEDVSDEKSSQPWLFTDNWPDRRAARRSIIPRRSADHSETIPLPPVLEKRSLVGFPKRNGHQKAPRGAMLVKMAGFPGVKNESGTWVGFSKNNITCALIFQTKFLGVRDISPEISWGWSWRKDWFSKV